MILVSAFEKFNGHDLNSSEEVLKQLSAVEKTLLPVTYAESWVRLHHQLQILNPEVLLMLGQAHGRSEVNLEKVGLNLIDTEIADESGRLIQDTMIDSKGEAALLTNVDLHKAKKILAPLSVKISYTAGAFVCNFLYYQALTWCLQRNVKVLFVHLPLLPEQGERAANAHLSLERQVEIVQKLVNHFQLGQL